MAEERSLFERLESVEATGEKILDILQSQNNQKSQQVKSPSVDNSGTYTYASPQVEVRTQQSEKEILQTFLKRATKFWRWFGNKKDFSKWKGLSIFASLLVILFGVISTIITGISCNMYSGFSILENSWIVFGIIYLVYSFKAQQIYEVNALASNSSMSYERDKLGMLFPRNEKAVFRVFRWITIIATILNIIFIWINKSSYSGLATVFEILFLGSVVFLFFMEINLFSQYCIIWVEGKNLATKEKVVLALPPGAKELMLEEDLRKLMPPLFE